VLFKRALLEKILKGEKTQTRRSMQRKPGRRVYTVGEIVGIRVGYTKPVAHIQIKKRFEQRLGDITEEQARKEGFSSVEEFKKQWQILQHNWNPEQIVWVYEFELAKQDSTNRDKPSQQATVESRHL
jgi:hypothetical protein